MRVGRVLGGARRARADEAAHLLVGVCPWASGSRPWLARQLPSWTSLAELDLVRRVGALQRDKKHQLDGKDPPRSRPNTNVALAQPLRTQAPSRLELSGLVPVSGARQTEYMETSQQTRSLAPDLARGFMLLLIAIANVSVHLWGREIPLYTTHPIDGGVLDRALSALAILFVDARIYPMFAFLFGYGMVQFARSRMARGDTQQRVASMFLRRHLWLIAFGFVHAALLFSGDILGAYGLTGLALTAALFWRSDRAVKITARVLLGLAALGALLFMAIMMLLAVFVPGDVWNSILGEELVGVGALTTGGASYGWSVLERIGLWLLATPGNVLALLVPACVLLGWLAGRHRWLEVPTARFKLGTVAVWGISVGAVVAAPVALSYLDAMTVPDPLMWGMMMLSSIAGVAGGIGYAALFGLLGQRLQGREGAVSRAIAAVGKRSLSSYLLQSMIFAPLLAAWGVGLGERIGTATAFAIALGVWLLSLVIAVLLERRGARGPAEVLLRRLTYGRSAEAPSVISGVGAAHLTASDTEGGPTSRARDPRIENM